MGQSGKDGCGEKVLTSGYIWKVEPTRFVGTLFMGCEKEKPRPQCVRPGRTLTQGLLFIEMKKSEIQYSK